MRTCNAMFGRVEALECQVNRKEKRLQALERQKRRIERIAGVVAAQYAGLFWLQLLVFVGGIGVTIGAFYFSAWLGFLCIAVTAAVFVYGARRQRVLQLRSERYRAWLRIKEAQMACMQLDWEPIPPVEDVRETDHPFENDLVEGLPITWKGRAKSSQPLREGL